MIVTIQGKNLSPVYHTSSNLQRSHAFETHTAVKGNKKVLSYTPQDRTFHLCYI